MESVLKIAHAGVAGAKPAPLYLDGEESRSAPSH